MTSPPGDESFSALSFRDLYEPQYLSSTCVWMGGQESGRKAKRAGEGRQLELCGSDNRQAGDDRGKAGRGREGWLGPRVIVGDDRGLSDSPCQLTTISTKRIHLVGRRRSPHVNRVLSFGTEDWLLSFPSCSTCLRVTNSSFRSPAWLDIYNT